MQAQSASIVGTWDIPPGIAIIHMLYTIGRELSVHKVAKVHPT